MKNRKKINWKTLGTIGVLLVAIICVGCAASKTINGDRLVYDSGNAADVAKTYNGITIDGVLNESEWGGFSAYECEIELNAVPHTFKISATTCEEGLILSYSLRGSRSFYNPAHSYSDCSCVELYLAPGDATQTSGMAWQIELLPNGTYNTMKHVTGGYTHYNAEIVYAATVNGVINEDNDGYDGEAMIPWSVLGEKMDTVCMDAAIIIQRDFEETRFSWDSVTSLTQPGYDWNNPQGWLKFTEFGWFDKNQPVAYKVNGGEKLEHATIEMVGSYNEGSVLTVMPEEGYVLKTLKINGTESYSLATVIPTGTVYANVEIEIVKAAGKKMEIPVAAGYAYAEKNNLKNAAITLVDAQENHYAGMTDCNGVLTIYLPDGEYTCGNNGYSGNKITVSDGVVSGLTDGKMVLTQNSITIDYIADSVKDFVSIKPSEKGDSFLFTGNNLDSAENRFVIGSGADYTDTVVMFTVGNTYGGWLDLRLDTIKQKNNLVTVIEHSSNAGDYAQLDFRTDGEKSTFQLGGGSNSIASNQTSASYMLTFTTENKITTVKLFVKNGETYEYYGYFKCDQVTDLFLSGVGASWYNPVAITDVKILSGDDIVTNITIAEGSSQQVEVSVKDKAHIGDKVQVVVAPKEALDADKETSIKAIYVNGEKIKFEVSYDGTVTFTLNITEVGQNYSIKVTTEEVNKTKEIDFRVVHKYENEDAYYALENAKVVFISTKETKYALCVSGSSYKIRLADGTYKVQIDEHGTLTVTVENGVMSISTLEFTREKVYANVTEDDKDKVTVVKRNDSYTIKTSGSISAENRFVFGSGMDFTDAMITMDIDYMVNVGSSDANIWFDFRMNSDDVYDSEKYLSANIYTPSYGKYAWDNGQGPYAMISFWKNSWTLIYKLGSEGQCNYFELSDDVQRPYDTASFSLAFSFKTEGDQTLVTVYVKQYDGTYGKIAEMTCAKVTEMFMLGTGSGLDAPMAFKNIKCYENAADADLVFEQ